MISLGKHSTLLRMTEPVMPIEPRFVGLPECLAPRCLPFAETRRSI